MTSHPSLQSCVLFLALQWWGICLLSGNSLCRNAGRHQTLLGFKVPRPFSSFLPHLSWFLPTATLFLSRISSSPLISHQQCFLSTHPWWSPPVHPPPLGLSSLSPPSPLLTAYTVVPPDQLHPCTSAGTTGNFHIFSPVFLVTFVTKVFLPGEIHFGQKG